MFKRIDHVAIHVSDLDRSVKFYEHHFGFSHYFQAGRRRRRGCHLKLGDTVLELTHHPGETMSGFTFVLRPTILPGLSESFKGMESNWSAPHTIPPRANLEKTVGVGSSSAVRMESRSSCGGEQNFCVSCLECGFTTLRADTARRGNYHG